MQKVIRLQLEKQKNLWKVYNSKKIQNANQLNIYFKTFLKPMVNKFIKVGFYFKTEKEVMNNT